MGTPSKFKGMRRLFKPCLQHLFLEPMTLLRIMHVLHDGIHGTGVTFHQNGLHHTAYMCMFSPVVHVGCQHLWDPHLMKTTLNWYLAYM